MVSSITEIADVAAIERRNEGASHGEQDVPRDHVRVVFIVLDFLTMFRRFLAAIEQRSQRMCARHNSDGVLLEEIEEALFLRPPACSSFRAVALERPPDAFLFAARTEPPYAACAATGQTCQPASWRV